MIDTHLSGQSTPQALLDGIAFPEDAYCEAVTSPTGPLRAHWQPLIEDFSSRGPETLQRLQERIQRLRHEDGAVFNPFDDSGEKGIPWALDMLPLPLSSAEWTLLERGLTQRARLMERILADVYGPQDLLKSGHLPAELIYANPRFLRSCHGIQPPGNRFLAYYAADLYRGADGRFRVFRDYADHPAGLGYALENRIIMSRVFSELYHKTQVRRLAPFFQIFHDILIRRAAFRRKDPDIVLLSPGPSCRIYFEHALLSRYLGYPLVEGQDLTVRNGEVFLKKLADLEPVDAVFRTIADGSSDPFALRREAGGGVAGLIQAAREQRIAIVNPIGSGFVDTPVLSLLLPALCRHLMGEELELENHAAWWCKTAEGRDHVLANLGHLTVCPAFDPTLQPVPSADAADAIRMTPHAFLAKAPPRPATVPCWSPEGVRPRYVLLRLFVCATDQGYAVMPGGLAITAPDADTLTGDNREQQQSKDIWVHSDQPVVPFSLMGGLETVAEFRRGSDLPSRVADHLLWLGRYLERAEGLIRLLRSVYRRLSGEAGLGDIPELPYLLSLLRAENAIPPAPEDTDSLPRYRELAAQLNAALYRQDRPETVVAILGKVQTAARNVRDRLSLDSWRVINRLESFADIQANDPLELLNDTLFNLNAFSGLAMESMTRGLGWRFMDMGRRIERAIDMTSLIRFGLPGIDEESRSALEAMLEVADSIMTYRARYRTVFRLAPALDLLLMDESNPRSLAFQCRRLAAHSSQLPRPKDQEAASPEALLAKQMLEAVRRLDLIGPEGDAGPIDHRSLMLFLETMEGQLMDFAQQVSAHYLSRVPATPHFSLIRNDREP